MATGVQAYVLRRVGPERDVAAGNPESRRLPVETPIVRVGTGTSTTGTGTTVPVGTRVGLLPGVRATPAAAAQGDPSTAVGATTTPANATAGTPSLASILSPGYILSGEPGGSDSSLPPPSAADVAALQPTAADTTSSGPSTLVVVILLVVALGAGIWYYLKHRKKASEPT